MPGASVSTGDVLSEQLLLQATVDWSAQASLGENSSSLAITS